MGGGLRHRRRALLPGVQPDDPGSKFDPDGTYVRRWVPDVDDAGYPEPIVDHKQEREEALRRYGRLGATT